MKQARDFEEFYAASYGKVTALVAAVLGDRDGADDVTQEAFARALARWPRLSGYELPEAWVRRVALRLAIDSGRRARSATTSPRWPQVSGRDIGVIRRDPGAVVPHVPGEFLNRQRLVFGDLRHADPTERASRCLLDVLHYRQVALFGRPDSHRAQLSRASGT